jgi:glucose/mannose-6-phosphate isomerase
MRPKNKEQKKEEKMLDLNSEEVKKLDPQNTVESTNLLLKQLKSAWDEVSSLEISEDYSSIKNIVFCGMGASMYGAMVAKSILGPDMKCPSEIVSDYHLPSYVNDETLVVLTSYSGSTEEVLSCAEEAKAKNAKMIVLTKGGKLGEFATSNKIPSYIFDGKLNPSGVPRLGLGYSILGLMGLLSKVNVMTFDSEKIIAGIKAVENIKEEIKEKSLELAEILEGKIPVIFSAEHLSGNAQILRNQFNETSKTFSAFYLVPDLNHHLMEGLQFPKPSELYFLLLDSNHYTPKIKRRMELTRDVVKQNNQIPHLLTSDGANIYEDVFIYLIVGSYLTLALGLIYRQNPAVNPWVDYFKEELNK